MVYHASQQAGLTRLLPHASTHGTPYVYAINNRLTALFFGAPKDDFDLLLDEEEGRPVVYEYYPNALERVYSGKPCSLYTLGEEGFLAFQTGWEPELVCPEPAAVVREERIGDFWRKSSEERPGENVRSTGIRRMRRTRRCSGRSWGPGPGILA